MKSWQTFFTNFIFIITLSLLMTVTQAATSSSPHHSSPTSKAKQSTTKKPVQLAQLQKPRQPSTNSNLWKQISLRFSLKHYENTPQVQEQIQWFQAHPDYLARVSDHGKYYMYFVYHEVMHRQLPGELVLLPMIESAYDPFAYSWVGASGIWQLMPQTATGLGVKQDWWYDGRKAIKPSTQAALDYLTYLGSFFNQDWLLAIAAYNAGEGRVQSAINHNAQSGSNTKFWYLPLPKETENYVPRLLALAAIVQNPARYHVSLPYLPNQPYFGEVELDHQLDLPTAAKMCNLPLEDLYALNPGYTRWATDPNGPYYLLIPINKLGLFEANFFHLKNKVETMIKYTVQKGETLKSICQKFDIDADTLMTINKLKNDTVQQGQQLLIPKTAKKAPEKPALTPAPAPVKSQATVKHYQVKSGDTLWSIAQHNGIKLEQLMAFNHLNQSSDLIVGHELLIPTT